MKRLALTVGLLAASTAEAGTWSDYGNAFPAFPCHDGWVGCKVDGQDVTPEMVVDSDGLPIPADMRIGWFDLEATSALSAFVGLSAYTGEVESVAPDPVPVAKPVPVAPRPAPPARPSTATPDPAPSRAPVPDPEPVAVMNTPAPAPAPAPAAVVHPTAAPEPAPAPELMVDPAALVIPSATDPAPDAAAVDTCDNLVALEPSAMMGKLSKGQMGCLETKMSTAAKQTEKEKISLILQANAYAKKDVRGWEQLVKRHLDEIDQSNPDLCYKYARHLSKKGPSRSHGVIRWSDVALENRTRWTGDTYTSRVYGLYKLKAAASQSLWESAEAEYAATPGEDTKKKVEDYRNKTKVYSREWLEYAKVAGKDITVPLQLCTSAAGTKDYCGGI
jgi:hypothetical protein